MLAGAKWPYLPARAITAMVVEQGRAQPEATCIPLTRPVHDSATVDHDLGAVGIGVEGHLVAVEKETGVHFHRHSVAVTDRPLTVAWEIHDAGCKHAEWWVRITMAAPTFAEVVRSKYVLLTTFTRDGRPKPTPIRGVITGETLLVFTGRDSWKVRRLRHDAHAQVAVCDRRGRCRGEGVPAIATLLDRSATQRVYDAKRRQYRLGGWWYILFTRLDGGIDNRIGIEIAAAPTDI